MTTKEFAHATMLVSSLRTRLGHANALTAAVTSERDDLAKQLAAHVESLKLSNAQCGEYLRQNEQLRTELATARVSAASLERIQATAAKMQNKLAETTKDLAYSRLAVDTMCARDKRFKETGARCGAQDGEDIGDFIERSCVERKTLHSDLVEVRAALATVSEERDSLRRTLQEWEEEETKPHERVTADDVADHVVPPVLHVGEPDPVNDPKDAALEFRNVVPTPEMLKHVGYWDLVSGAAAIAFRSGGLRIVFWRIAGSQEWRTDPCPQPLKPHGMTWQQLDRALANTKSVPPVLPLCNVCHECGSELANCSQGTNHHDCPRPLCPRTCTGRHGGGFSPYSGPCKSATPVRHE